MTTGTGIDRTGILVVGDAPATAAEAVMTGTGISAVESAAGTGATAAVTEGAEVAKVAKVHSTTVAALTTDSATAPRRALAGLGITIPRVHVSLPLRRVARDMIMGDRTSSGRAVAPRALAAIRTASRQRRAPRGSST